MRIVDRLANKGLRLTNALRALAAETQGVGRTETEPHVAVSPLRHAIDALGACSTLSRSFHDWAAQLLLGAPGVDVSRCRTRTPQS